MRNIIEVYEEYKIMPQLQLHQLRVAAVAQLICDSFSMPVDTGSVITTCLLHDMGNIIKFDLGLFPEALEPKGLAYWKEVQDELRARYGTDEHNATIATARELGVSDKVFEYINSVGFSRAITVRSDPSFEKRICNYSDYRVSPFKIVSLEESLADRTERYKNHPTKGRDLNFVAKATEALIHMETDIFKEASIMPEDITNESVSGIIEKLKSFCI